MTSKIIRTGLAAILTSALLAPIPVVYAASDGGSSNQVTCKRKMVWDKKKKKCVKVKKSSGLDDDNLYEAARDLAYHQRYEEAIDVLKLAANPNDPRILNYMGYSTRKLGRVEEGLTYYQAALKADPDYTLVMEYMGEAFLQLGKVDKAREQLAEIEKRCGVGCREYTMLDKAITAHQSN